MDNTNEQPTDILLSSTGVLSDDSEGSSIGQFQLLDADDGVPSSSGLEVGRSI